MPFPSGPGRLLAATFVVATACSGGQGGSSASNGPDGSGARGSDSSGGRRTDASAKDASLDGPAPPPPFGFDARPSNKSCIAPKRPSNAISVGLAVAFPSLPVTQAPLGFLQAPNDPSRWFIVEQRGIVYAVSNKPDASALSVFVNIQDRVNSSSTEAGLLGMAFDPDFASNGVVYLSYTGHGGAIDLTSRLSRFLSRDGGKTIDPSSEEILLSLEQPYTNHNGGNIEFGPDGFLYLGFGDGGSGGDPLGNGQNRNVLFGKMLRLSVSATGPYGIPKTNPFALGGGKPEIFAFGFRNPWRWSFDRDTGDLWVGDVGQATREEIDRVKRGGNYGWRIHEGNFCPPQPCPTAGFIDPIVDYPHTEGVAVIGGYVYRGTAIPALIGTYVYADYVSAKIWALLRDPKTGAPAPTVIATAPSRISSFGQGVDGEIYVVQYNTGHILKLVPRRVSDAGTADAGASLPDRLSATGCVDPRDPTRFAEGVIPYGVNVPYWSDGADLARGVAIPDGTEIKVLPDGSFDLPNGSVLIQTASKNGKKLDTRFLVRHDDGDWSGFAYAWKEDQTDAALLRGPIVVRDGAFASYVPHPGECLSCHTAASGRVLGFDARELDRDFSYPNGASLNQLAQLEHIGLFDSPLRASERSDRYPSLDGSAPVGQRARAYLAVNCAMCHRPGGVDGGVPDLRFGTPAAATGLCRASPKNGVLGLAGALLVAPGLPDRSVLSLRMHADDWSRMPPLESALVDPSGAALVDAWIASGADCPPLPKDGGD